LRDDFFEITPGEKCKNQDELQNELLINKDRFADEREQILNLSYKYIDGDASERIYKFLLQEYSINPIE
jgi:CDP-glycerol glycerophosphotransferase (TagB/SpsB family)